MTKPKIKAVLFDLDGTLATSVSSLMTSYQEFLGTFNTPGSKEEFDELTGPSLFEVTEILARRHSLPGDIHSLYSTYLSIVEREYLKDVSPREGARELLKWLSDRNIVSGLVTSAPKQLTMSFLQRHGLLEAFAVIVTGDDVSDTKPAPAPYLQALEKLALRACEAIAVEDSPKGIQSAKNAEMRVVGISAAPQDHLLKAGATITVDRLIKIQAYIAEDSD